MAESEHTPGPWIYQRGEWGYHGDPEEDSGFHILMGATAINSLAVHGVEEHLDYAVGLYPEDGDQYVTAEANARLMAAAPDLLAALENFIYEASLPHNAYIDVANVEQAQAAIAKAKGEE